MHKEIARRYHISRDECLWLENMVDSTNLYVFDRQFKRIVHETILSLEEEEEKKLKEQS